MTSPSAMTPADARILSAEEFRNQLLRTHPQHNVHTDAVRVRALERLAAHNAAQAERIAALEGALRFVSHALPVLRTMTDVAGLKAGAAKAQEMIDAAAAVLTGSAPPTRDAMDIYSPPGTRVVFAFPDAGYESDQRTAAKHLRVGATYTVEATDVGDWHTNVSLKEIPRVAFNSVHFAKAPGDTP